MKKCFIFILLCLAASPLLPARAETLLSIQERPPAILYTYYHQAGWGNRVQVGCLDSCGGLWRLAGDGRKLQWPYETAGQMIYLQAGSGFERVGELSHSVLSDLESLISDAEDQGSRMRPAACDAGTEYSYAVRHAQDGTSQIILLGASGDNCFENTDPSAQALYSWLRKTCPWVRSFAGTDNMGPRGFAPVSIRSFCGWEDIDFSSAAVSGVYMDFEAGCREIVLGEKEQDEIRRLAMEGQVTGKVSAMQTTGGLTRYCFRDQKGDFLASMKISGHLLVREDGMYGIAFVAPQAEGGSEGDQ